MSSHSSRATGNSHSGISGNWRSIKLKVFQNCHFFLDSDGSILRKTSLFRCTFRWRALNSEQLSHHILFCGTIEWLIRTRSKLNRFNFKHVQHHCQYDLRKYKLANRVIPIMEQLPITTPYRHHRQQLAGLHTEWENSVKPATHGPTLTADTNDRHCQPTLSIDILTAECRHWRPTKLRATASK